MHIPSILKPRVCAPAGALLFLLVGAGYLLPNSTWEGAWTTQYPSSATGNAGCQTCHGLSTTNLNGYGRAMQQQSGASILARIIAVQGANSDGDPGGSSNLAEINAGAQPGWTSGNNTVYNRSTGVTSINQPPTGLLLDPPTAPPPAPEINVTPLSLEFGATTVGASATQTTVVQNLGSANLTVSSLALGGSPDFVVDPATPSRPITVPAGGSVNIVLRYTPSGTGDDSGELSISNNDSDEATVNVSLHGSGTPPASVCDINVSPLSRNFGTVAIGQSATLPVSIGNTGTGPCSVTTLTVGPAEFALGASTPARPFTVQTGGAVNVQIVYTPVNLGADSGSLQVASNDPDENPVTVTLSGTGSAALLCDIQVSPTSLNFGGVPVGSSASLSTTVANTGNASCMVNSAGLSGSAEFAISPALPALPLTLTPGENFQISVAYTPTGLGDDAGALNVATSDPGQPTVAVSLAGAGVQVSQDCDIQVAPLSLEFGPVAVGTGRNLSTTISNPGQAQCMVSWQLPAGGDFALLTAAPPAPLAVAPGGSVSISVRYTPSGPGDDAGTLQITSNDPDEAAVPVALAGSGFTSDGVVDLVITRLDATKEVRLQTSGGESQREEADARNGGGGSAVSIRLVFKNNGQVAQPRLATVTGVQNGREIYNESQMLSVPAGRGKAGSATFPPYFPTAAGVITWTAAIVDEVPEGSTAQATTNVRGPRVGSTATDDDERDGATGRSGDSDEGDDDSQEGNRSRH